MTNYYFLGIGGVGMSAIARYLHNKGFVVGGYDKVCSELSKKLQSEGIEIHYTDLGEYVDEKFKNPDNTIIVYTPAVPESHCEFKYFRDNNFRILKRSEILGQITKFQRGICVAGTHGKTTTSTMIAHLLRESSINCNAFLGGVSLNYKSNLLMSDKSNLVVIEADEYDRSFHRLSPFMAVVTSIDADHLDIYHTHKEYIEAFRHFTSLIQEGGALIYKKGIEELKPNTKDSVRVYSYSSTEKADFYAENIRIGGGKLFFDFVCLGVKIKDLELGVPIFINVENAVAAMAIAWLNGVTEAELRLGIASYSGVRRRFEKHLELPKIFIDDYAHHPKELASSIESIKLLYPDKNILGVFQPHLYSRTKDFYLEFAEALSMLDQVILVEIYPAREEPISGITSEIILKNITISNKRVTTKNNLIEEIKKSDFDVIITLGAGDIDTYIPKIKESLMAL